MDVKLVSPPAEKVVSLAAAKQQLRIDPSFNLDDAYIETLVDAATAYLDGRGGILGRAIVSQTWAGVIDYEWPCEISVPLPPLQSVSEIRYIAPDGVEKVLDADQYRVITTGEPGLVVPAWGVSWPDVRRQRGAITVTFVAGYGAAADAPANIGQMVLFLVSHWYMQRVPVTVGSAANKIPQTFDALFNNARIWGF
jgi:uncharacterized phiE125 gp8 family phage protein